MVRIAAPSTASAARNATPESAGTAHATTGAAVDDDAPSAAESPGSARMPAPSRRAGMPSVSTAYDGCTPTARPRMSAAVGRGAAAMLRNEPVHVWRMRNARLAGNGARRAAKASPVRHDARTEANGGLIGNETTR
jgi:hypothetical protein